MNLPSLINDIPMVKTSCSRCDRDFASSKALQQHYDNSLSHNWCPICGFDGTDREDLLAHQRETNHRALNGGCCDKIGMIWRTGSPEHLAHLEENNVCLECDRHFESPSNLDNHKLVHLEPSIECYGCDRIFTTYPAMIIHLESSTCPSGIDKTNLNESAAMCFQWKTYMDEDHQDGLLNREDLASLYGKVYPYRCPGCDNCFTKLSGLFQHVQSKACDQKLEGGGIAKLIRWLENRHRLTPENEE